MSGICDGCGKHSSDLKAISTGNFADICVCKECLANKSEPTLQIEEVEQETSEQRNERRLRELLKSFGLS